TRSMELGTRRGAGWRDGVVADHAGCSSRGPFLGSPRGARNLELGASDLALGELLGAGVEAAGAEAERHSDQRGAGEAIGAPALRQRPAHAGQQPQPHRQWRRPGDGEPQPLGHLHQPDDQRHQRHPGQLIAHAPPPGRRLAATALLTRIPPTPPAAPPSPAAPAPAAGSSPRSAPCTPETTPTSSSRPRPRTSPAPPRPAPPTAPRSCPRRCGYPRSHPAAPAAAPPSPPAPPPAST